MRTSDVAKRLDVNTKTIGRWTDRFSDFLSPQKGRWRIFNSKDLAVMHTIAKLSSEGMKYDAIEQRLLAGERVELDPVDSYPEGTVIPVSTVDQLIDASELRLELNQTKNALAKVLEDKEDLEDRLHELQQRYDSREDEIRELNKTINDLNREIIDLLKENRDK